MKDSRLWLSPRALRLHAVILIVVPGFMALCLWQLSRALGGNTLSWAYVFEWPLFAGYAIYMWWRLVHEAPEGTPPPASAGNAAGGPDDSAAPDPAGTPRQQEEDAELAAYNEYLAQLAERDKATDR
jgi:DNA-binding transcriptional regulator of glucitol operon